MNGLLSLSFSSLEEGKTKWINVNDNEIENTVLFSFRYFIKPKRQTQNKLAPLLPILGSGGGAVAGQAESLRHSGSLNNINIMKHNNNKNFTSATTTAPLDLPLPLPLSHTPASGRTVDFKRVVCVFRWLNICVLIFAFALI